MEQRPAGQMGLEGFDGMKKKDDPFRNRAAAKMLGMLGKGQWEARMERWY